MGLEQPESGAILLRPACPSTMQLRRRIFVVIERRIRPGSIYENIVGSQPLSLDRPGRRRGGGGGRHRADMMGMHTVLQQAAGSCPAASASA